MFGGRVSLYLIMFKILDKLIMSFLLSLWMLGL